MSMTVAARLVSIRKEKALSQKDAAKALGVSQALLSHYENGIRECGLSFLRRAASFYDVSTDYLLGMTDARIPTEMFLDFSDTAQDKELKMRTVFRAAVVLLEKLSACGAENGERVKTVYLLTIYKIYLCALSQGILPADSKLHPELTPYLCSSMLDYILSGIASDSKPQNPDALPLCVDTVVTEALRLIESEIEEIYSISKN